MVDLPVMSGWTFPTFKTAHLAQMQKCEGCPFRTHCEKETAKPSNKNSGSRIKTFFKKITNKETSK